LARRGRRRGCRWKVGALDGYEETRLATVVQQEQAAGPVFVVQDDTPLWLAWETAKESWLESKRRRSGGENTVRAYALAVRQFFEWAAIEPWQVSPAVAQEWAVWMSTDRDGQGPLSKASIGLKLAALSSFYDFVQKRYAFHNPRDGRDISLWPADRMNPFGAVERPKISPYGRSKFPSVDELKAILGAINTACLAGKRDFALLFTVATTCRRSSEILNLKWGDLQEMEDGDFCLEYRGKGGEVRKAVLNRKAYQAICAYVEMDGRPVEGLGEEDFIFVPMYPGRIRRLRPDAEVDGSRPISNSQANRILKKYARRAGVEREKAHLHGLRHAGARLRVQQMRAGGGGVDYMELMELLGHSSLAVTQIYSQQVLEEPEDPGGEAAAEALLPKGRRRRRKPAAEQGKLL